VDEVEGRDGLKSTSYGAEDLKYHVGHYYDHYYYRQILDEDGGGEGVAAIPATAELALFHLAACILVAFVVISFAAHGVPSCRVILTNIDRL